MRKKTIPQILVDYMMNGYDIHFDTLRTPTGLFHPDSKDMVEIILAKRLPGLKRKGGNAFAKAKMKYTLLNDPKKLIGLLEFLQGRVDLINETHKHKNP